MRISAKTECLYFLKELGGIDNAYWIGEAIDHHEFSQIPELLKRLPESSKILVARLVKRHILS